MLQALICQIASVLTSEFIRELFRMSTFLEHTVSLSQKVLRKPNSYISLTYSTSIILFQLEYLICNTLTGEVISHGKFSEPLYYPAHLNNNLLVGIFLQKGSIVIFDLKQGKVTNSVDLDLKPPEWIDTMMTFRDGSVCYLSRSPIDSSLNFLDQKLQTIQKYKIGAETIIDKIEDRSTVAAHSQNVTLGSIPIGLFRADMMNCQSLTITDISYPEDSLLQKVWSLADDKMLLAFNYKNLCFWEIHNVVTQEKITMFEHRDLMQSPVLLKANRMSYIGIKKKLVDKQARHNLYSVDYQNNFMTDLPIFFEGEMTTQGEESLLICETSKDLQLKLRTYKLISKESKYIHLLKKTGVIKQYGSLITQACLDLLK